MKKTELIINSMEEVKLHSSEAKPDPSVSVRVDRPRMSRKRCDLMTDEEIKRELAAQLGVESMLKTPPYLTVTRDDLFECARHSKDVRAPGKPDAKEGNGCQTKVTVYQSVLPDPTPDDISVDAPLTQDVVIPIHIDDSKANGLISQLEADLEIWRNPCIIRLSDILKKSEAFMSKRAIIEYVAYGFKRPGILGKCLRNYSLPYTHIDAVECTCVFCRACTESMINLETIGYSTQYVCQCLTKVICKRLKTILQSQVQITFQEESINEALDERLCYGFRHAIPSIAIINFENLFKAMYKVGTDVVYDVVKKLGVLIKYTPSYTSAFHFLSFFIEVTYKLACVIDRLQEDLDFFDWKLLQLLKINVTTFFRYIFDSHLYRDPNFQEILAMCRRIVFRYRRNHPRHATAKYELDTHSIRFYLSQIRVAAIRARNEWDNKKRIPFSFEEYTPSQQNIFKIAPLRNPFEKLKYNDTYGYEVIQSPKTNRPEFRSLTSSMIPQCDFGDPLLDITIAKPGNDHEHFAIRLYKQYARLSVQELDSMMETKDVVFIAAHRYNCQLSRNPDNCYEEYLLKRKEYNLDEVEGPLPPEIESYLNDGFFSSVLAEKAKMMAKLQHLKRKRKVDPLWPSLFYVRKRRCSESALKKMARKNRKRSMKWGICACTRECHKVESQGYRQRFQYSFGGYPEANWDPPSALMGAQKWEFLQEVISSALQIGASSLNPATTQSDTQLRYFALFTHINTENLSKSDKPSLTKRKVGPCLEDLFDIIRVHYDVLAKYDLISVEESLRSPHMQEKEWAKTNWEDTGEIPLTADDKIKRRMAALKRWNSGVPYASKKRMCSDQFLISHQKRNAGKKGDENILAISDGGRIVGYATRGCIPDDGLKSSAAWKKQEFDAPPNHSCPHNGKGFKPERHDHPQHTHTHVHNHGPGPCPSGVPRNPKTGKCGEHEKKSSRPGLPVSVGYAEKRQNLRLKLAREKKEKEESLLCDDVGCHNCGASKKTKKETITVTTQALPTEDIDEIVNLIEGVKISDSNHRNSSASESTDLKKAAKKARKKEKKEQKRLEQEEEELQAKLEEERARQKEEEERLQREEAEREEELRKKREKRKKKKTKSKKSESEDIETCKEDIPTDTGTPSKSKPLTKPQLSEAHNDKKLEQKTMDPSKPEMVTIRRHATAPDTTVTISVKSDNGEEDLLYTLVNGQVVRMDGKKTDTKSNGSHSPEPNLTQNADKKSKKKTKKSTSLEEEKLHSKISVEPKVELLKESSVLVVENKRVNSPSQVVSNRAKSRASNTTNSPIHKSHEEQPKSFFVLKDEKGNQVDVSQLKLPPGITITQLKQDSNSNKTSAKTGHENAGESRNISSVQRNERSYGGCYDDDYFYQRETGEFEEVVSNKTRRARNKNKQKDDDDETEGQDRMQTRKWSNTEHLWSGDNAGVDNMKSNVQSVANSSRSGKRAFESYTGGTITYENSNRQRKPSGGVGNNTRMHHNQKFGTPKSRQTPTPVTHNSESFVSSVQTDSIHNGRGGKFIRGVSNSSPRLSKPGHTVDYGRSMTTTASSQFNPFSTNTQVPSVVPVQPQHTNVGPYDQNYSRNGSGMQYLQPIKKPNPVDSNMDSIHNGHQNYSNFTPGDTNMATEFQEYSPWGPKVGGSGGFLGSLLKDIQGKRTEKDTPSTPFGFGYSVPNFANDGSKAYNTMWGTRDTNQGGTAAQTSAYQTQHVPHFNPNSYGQNTFDGSKSCGIGGGVIGNMRAQSSDISYQRNQFGENTAPRIISPSAVQRPTHSPMMNQFSGGPFDPFGLHFQQANNTTDSTNIQARTRPNEAEYSLF